MASCAQLKYHLDAPSIVEILAAHASLEESLSLNITSSLFLAYISA
jgi:hypothetical protein